MTTTELGLDGTPRSSALLKGLSQALAVLMCVAVAVTPAWGQDNGLLVTVPNGYANISAVDLSVQSTAGQVLWTRVWDGQEWKFNPHWESLSQSWKNMTGSQTADTTAGTVTGSGTSSNAGSNVAIGSTTSSGGSDGGCWVWVDEDWAPTQVGTVLIGGQPDFGSMMAERTTPFNRIMGEDETDYPPPVRVSVDYAGLCAGSMAAGGSSLRDTEGIRRANELYLGDGGRYAFSNREVLEKRSVRQLPTMSAGDWYSSLGEGQITLTPETNSKGFRWMDKSGDWIDYNTQGQVVAWGDRNDNLVWLARDAQGVVRGVIDAQGRVLFSLHYNGPLISEIRDYPMAGNAQDLPARTIKYFYDERNRLSRVVDARGNDSARYEYNIANRITKITDAEDRAEQLEYSGETARRRIAPDGAVTDYVFEYDDTNKQFISKITGPETEAGRKVEDYTHNRSSKLVRRIVNGQTFEEVRYDTGNRVELTTNARGFTTRTTRNEFDQAVRVDYPDGGSALRTFSALHLQLVEQTDELGVKTRYEYDARGNLLKKVEAAGLPEERVTEYELDAQGRATRITFKGRTETDASITPDAVWQLEYDVLGNISRSTDPEGVLRRYSYDRAGNLVAYTNANGQVWNYGFDGNGNLTVETDPLGRSNHYSYDKVGNQQKYVNARGKAVLAAFDAMDRNIRITNEVGGIYQIRYNGQGLPVSETDEDGRTSRAEFDNFLRLSKEIDGLGHVTEYGYSLADGSDNGSLGALFEPTEIQYPTYTERRRLDERERNTNRTLLNPTSQGTEGLVSSNTYDKRGQMIADTDPNGKTHFYKYDALGRLLEFTDSLGATTRATYDVRGNLTSITDANANRNRFEYDRNDRVVKEILPLGQATEYAYDPAGNLQRRIDANGHRSEYDYDAANRLREVRQYSQGNVLQRKTNYVWSETDKLLSWSDIDFTRPSGQQTSNGEATYDDADRKLSENVDSPDPRGGSFRLAYRYAYSEAGRKTSLVWADGTELSYGYSSHGELQSVTIPGQGTISVDQYQWAAPRKLTLPGGVTVEKGYDGLLDLENLQVKTPGQQTVLSVANTYGKLQELKSSNRTDGFGSASASSNSSYEYDFETRLTRASTLLANLLDTDTENFTLDAVGNPVSYSKVNGAWQYDANNRLLRRGEGSAATHFTYDAVGNLVRAEGPGGKVSIYHYDTQNRLIEIRDGNDNLFARYGYDPFDRRIWREQYRSRNGNALGEAHRTYYLYADEGLIAEATQPISVGGDGSVAASSAPVIATQYGPRMDAEFTTSMLFVKTKNSNGSDTFAYYHHDNLGKPLQATDAAGNIVWSASYSAYGKALITTPTATVEHPTIASSLRLPGQIEDDESGLHYNYRRYYDPESGRYITQDPIGLEGGLNLYRYARANPINMSDPTGECPMCVMYAVCVAQCMIEDAVVNAATGECNDWGNSAKSCALSCVLGPLLSKVGKWANRANKACSINSFPGETVVHTRPAGVDGRAALMGVSALLPISMLKPGDEVLAFSEWKAQAKGGQDQRLSYEKVVDVYTSEKLQTLVRLTLDDGNTLEATEGHPFKTSEGWRDAIILKKGDRLMLKASAESVATIVAITTERRLLPVFNIEVANAHTYFVGVNGELVHNGRCTPRMRKEWEKIHNKPWPKNPMTEKIRPGGNQDGHHIIPKSKGGPDHGSNITPKTPSEHIQHHQEHGYK